LDKDPRTKQAAGTLPPCVKKIRQEMILSACMGT
jgi:hypothetical protein